jgi:hypothetical protein
MEHEIYISGPHKQRNGTYRVAVKWFSGNLNSLDATYAEQTCRTEASAQRLAEKWARDYQAVRRGAADPLNRCT